MKPFYGPRTSTPKPYSVQNRSHRQHRIDSFSLDDVVDASEQMYNTPLFDVSDDLQSHLYQQSFTSSSEHSRAFDELREQEYKTHRKDVYKIKTRQINNLFQCIQLKLHSMHMRMHSGDKSDEMHLERIFQDDSFCLPITVISDGVKHTAM